jgi:hypothetical protein
MLLGSSNRCPIGSYRRALKGPSPRRSTQDEDGTPTTRVKAAPSRTCLRQAPNYGPWFAGISIRVNPWQKKSLSLRRSWTGCCRF